MDNFCPFCCLLYHIAVLRLEIKNLSYKNWVVYAILQCEVFSRLSNGSGSFRLFSCVMLSRPLISSVDILGPFLSFAPNMWWPVVAESNVGCL